MDCHLIRILQSFPDFVYISVIAKRRNPEWTIKILVFFLITSAHKQKKHEDRCGGITRAPK